MYGLIADLNADGVTILMVTHDVGPALQAANRILHIGGSLFCGSREEYLQTGAGRRFARQEGAPA